MKERIPHTEGVDNRFFKIKTIYPTKYLDLPNGETLGYREAGKPELGTLIMVHGNFECSVQ